MRASTRSVLCAAASCLPCLFGCGAGDDTQAPAVTTEAGAAADATVAGDADAAAIGTGDASAAIDATRASADAAASDGSDASTSGDGAPADGQGDVAPGIAATSTRAGLRLANWSPDAPPLDFCVAPHGSTAFQGPIVGTAQALADAGVTGVSFPQVSAYALVASGAYDVRVVPGGSGIDCAAALSLLVDGGVLGVNNVALTGEKGENTKTVAVIGEATAPAGDAGAPLRLLVLADEFDGPAPTVLSDGGVVDRFAVRFVHAAPTVATVAVSAAVSSLELPLTPKTLFPWSLKTTGFGAFASVDGGNEGYKKLPLPPPANLQPAPPVQRAYFVDVVPSAADAGLFPSAFVRTGPGAVITLVLGGGLPGGAPVILLACNDNVPATAPLSPGDGAATTCRVLTDSTCGDGVLDPFEECDCGSPQAITSTDPQCTPGITNGNLGDLGHVGTAVCSPACRLN